MSVSRSAGAGFAAGVGDVGDVKATVQTAGKVPGPKESMLQELLRNCTCWRSHERHDRAAGLGFQTAEVCTQAGVRSLRKADQRRPRRKVPRRSYHRVSSHRNGRPLYRRAEYARFHQNDGFTLVGDRSRPGQARGWRLPAGEPAGFPSCVACRSSGLCSTHLGCGWIAGALLREPLPSCQHASNAEAPVLVVP